MNMTNFLHDKRATRGQRTPVLMAIGLGIFLFIIIVFPKFSGVVVRMDARVWDTQASFMSTVKTVTKSKKNLLRDIDILEERVNTLEIERLQFEAYDTLTPASTDHTLDTRMIALVTTRPPQTLYDTFIVDLGERDGVRIGDRVYVHDRILFGTVVNVSATTAQVHAFSSPGQTIPVYHGVSKTALTLEGRGNGNFRVDVPQEVDIVEGDVLLAEDRAQHVVAVVEHIVIDERDPFKHVYVRVPANMNGIHVVQIEKNS